MQKVEKLRKAENAEVENRLNKKITLDKLNRNEALRYLGYKDFQTDDMTESLLNLCEEEVIKNAVPRYTYRIVDFTRANEGVSIEGTSLILKGDSIKEHLEGCEKAALMAVTLSEGIDRMLRVMSGTDMAKAVVSDSLASVAVEQVCDKVELIIKEELPEYNQTFRFGIGYGDLPIEHQKEFLTVLNAPKLIGLNVSSSSMLTPTKSVTAIIGLTKGRVKASNRGCASCNLKGTCRFRKAGGHCNG